MIYRLLIFLFLCTPAFGQYKLETRTVWETRTERVLVGCETGQCRWINRSYMVPVTKQVRVPTAMKPGPSVLPSETRPIAPQPKPMTQPEPVSVKIVHGETEISFNKDNGGTKYTIELDGKQINVYVKQEGFKPSTPKPLVFGLDDE